jgi:hypothetical protein
MVSAHSNNACPKCLKGDGIPTLAVTRLDSRIVILRRCEACHFEWHTLSPASLHDGDQMESPVPSERPGF